MIVYVVQDEEGCALAVFDDEEVAKRWVDEYPTWCDHLPHVDPNTLQTLHSRYGDTDASCLYDRRQQAIDFNIHSVTVWSNPFHEDAEWVSCG